MPIYEYRCEDCGLTSEFLVGPGGEVNPVCQACGSHKMGRVMSAASILRSAYQRPAGHTCCGREERCDSPACSTGAGCGRH